MFNQMKTIIWGDTTLLVSHSYPKYEDMHKILNYQSLTLEAFEYNIWYTNRDLFGIQL